MHVINITPEYASIIITALDLFDKYVDSTRATIVAYSYNRHEDLSIDTPSVITMHLYSIEDLLRTL